MENYASFNNSIYFINTYEISIILNKYKTFFNSTASNNLSQHKIMIYLYIPPVDYKARLVQHKYTNSVTTMRIDQIKIIVFHSGRLEIKCLILIKYFY
jgi:hypothetical protein